MNHYNNFKKNDPLLYKSYKEDIWRLGLYIEDESEDGKLFSVYGEDMIHHCYYSACIPFIRNEQLLGKE